MSRINKIEVTNFKAITDLSINFNGATAILTGKNESGKTSFLRGIADRIRGEQPKETVKRGEKAGKGTMTLTSGEIFTWEFDVEGKDKLTLTTDKNLTIPVTRAIADLYFKPSFDIDEFLQAAPKDAAKMLQKLIGVDFTQINAAYKLAYDERTTANTRAKDAKAKVPMDIPAKVEAVDVTELIKQKEEVRKFLNALYLTNKSGNAILRTAWQDKCEATRTEIEEFNDAQEHILEQSKKARHGWQELIECGYEGDEVEKFILKLESTMKEKKVYQAHAEPEYIQELPDDSALKDIDEKINTASDINTKAAAYSNYLNLQIELGKLNDAATEADQKVQELELKKKQMLLEAKLPEGITLTEEGIFVDRFPLQKNQISSSKLYTTALKLASLNLGEVKTLFFDASTLDGEKLAEIEAWAEKEGYQLLIERPAFDAGEIKYELVEQVPS